MEVNFITNIEVRQSLNQIQLSSALISEFLRIFEPFYSDIIISLRPKITFPYQDLQQNLADIKGSTKASNTEAALDSGFETSDFRSNSVDTRVRF